MRFIPLILFFAVFLSPFVLIAEGQPSFPFLSVVGHAEYEIPPDKSEVSFRIVTFAEESEDAVKKIVYISNHVNKIITELGIDPKHVNSFDITKKAKRFRHRESQNELQILGYEMNQNFNVVIFDLLASEKLVNKLLVLNGVEGINVTFDLQSRKEIEQRLSVLAGKDAKQRAENLALGVGATIGSVYSVREQGRSYQAFGVRQNSSMRENLSINPPETITVTKSIEVIYRINP
ncbi:SIMPL domain-containing protein [Psychrosphaera sp. B3R10]|uniref:SIMPL domain-containing protein n=1 Tax=unclassified Psychrosphaera TaxID=2641570 RepID=UPI001C08BF90|nr:MULTISPECIES: SIMPL domain-containing protein [unclassified Psychrosphaera]MBU2881950.1 SIMPL domain-containing protein [Psychrosphaera sp. I2R16]MBU2991261.1 SIMPL domain-containing protein [Psychrosphaera sp. B3R10]